MQFSMMSSENLFFFYLFIYNLNSSPSREYLLPYAGTDRKNKKTKNKKTKQTNKKKKKKKKKKKHYNYKQL